MNKKKTAAASATNPKKLYELKSKIQFSTVRFSPDGKLLVASGYDSLIHRWNSAGPKEATPLDPFDAGGGWVQGMAFHPKTGRLFTSDSWGELACWNAADAKPAAIWKLGTAHDGWIHGMALSPDGSHLATAGLDGAVRVWSTEKGSKIAEWRDHPRGDVLSVAIHPDGKSIVAGDLYGRIVQRTLGEASPKPSREFDASKLHMSSRLQEVGGARTMLLTRDGSQLLVGGTIPANGGNVQGKATILGFDWKTGKPTKTWSLKDSGGAIYIDEIAEHPAGYLMLPLSGNPGSGGLALMKLSEEKPFFFVSLANCHSVALDAATKRLAVVATGGSHGGNGRQLVNGEYVGNFSPVVVFELPA